MPNPEEIEREAIVRWLREYAELGPQEYYYGIMHAADVSERGDHLSSIQDQS